MTGVRFEGTTASFVDVEYVKSLGAATVVDYKTSRFEQVVPPVDVVIDTVGGDTNSALTNAWRRATSCL